MCRLAWAQWPTPPPTPGHYTLNEPGSGPYLIRVTHQGAGYFIAAPQGGGPGDIPVYDVASKVKGVYHRSRRDRGREPTTASSKSTSAISSTTPARRPPRNGASRSFSIVLPADATISDVGAQRPNGLPTSVKLDPDGPKGHYSFNFPIQPDDGDKDTMFQVSYSLPYSAANTPSSRRNRWPPTMWPCCCPRA